MSERLTVPSPTLIKLKPSIVVVELRIILKFLDVAVRNAALPWPIILVLPSIYKILDSLFSFIVLSSHTILVGQLSSYLVPPALTISESRVKVIVS